MINSTENLWRIWDPPSFPSPPHRNYDQYILYLKQFLFVQKFVGSLEQNPLLNGKIEPSDYQKLLHSVNHLLNAPFLHYTLIKCILTFMNFIASVSLILFLIFEQIPWAIVSGVALVFTLVLIRFSGNLYFKAMKKLREEIQINVDKLQNEFLGNTDIRMYVGDFCAWIEFAQWFESEQDSVSQKTLKVFDSGSIKSKRTISWPLMN